MLALDSPVAELRLKPKDVRGLERQGVRTVRELLLELPYELETFGPPTSLARSRGEGSVLILGRVTSVNKKVTRYKRMMLVEAAVVDDDGARLELTFFNQPWMAQRLQKGLRVGVAGSLEASAFGARMVNPHVEPVAAGGAMRLVELQPKYHMWEGINAKRRRELLDPILFLAAKLEDSLPASTLARERLMPVAQAVLAMHRPESEAHWREAQRRMMFAELLELQVAFVVARRRMESEPATPVPYVQEVIETYRDGLPFRFTEAQRRSTWEILKDLGRSRAMNRLLDGDVGSGKTAVAAAAVAMTHAAGLQSLVMAPTEILARQHLGKFRQYLEGSFPGLTVDLLVSSLAARERRRVIMAAASGQTALIVGTHALLEGELEVPRLGLAVVDEQHRFGTRQRDVLRSRGGGRPHFLAMTATPIPRTLALALYGEMDLSVLDELPPGRTPIRTRVLSSDQRAEAYALVREEVGKGHQAFIICPLIEASEAVESKAATEEYERLRRDVFPDLTVALVHGRMRDKDSVMREFAEGRADILVATAVVEVGVDIPNATVMLIEGAERFGLAQLHQFRGRVGRGTAESHCILLAGEAGERTLERILLLESVHDGFRLAREDIKLRGAGQLMGVRQHGMSDTGMNAVMQPKLLDEARLEAERIIDEDPELQGNEGLRLAVERRVSLTLYA